MNKKAKSSPAFRLTKCLAVSLGVSVAAISLPSAKAASETWVGTSDANWSTSGNWSPNATLTSGADALVFGADPGSGTTLNNDLSGLSVTGITFNAGAAAWTLGGNALSLGGTIANSSTSLQSINNAISTTAVRTVSLTAGGGNITLGGNLSGTGGGLTTSGTGTLTLSGNNSFTGALTVAANTTAILSGSNGARPAGTNGLTTVTGTLQLQANPGNVVSGTSFALSAEQTANQPLTLNNGSTLQLRSDTSVTFVGANNLGGVGNATLSFDVNNNGSGTGNTLTVAPAGFGFAATTINITGGNGYTLATGTLTGVNFSTKAITLNPTTANLTVAGIASSYSGPINVQGAGNTTVTGLISGNGALNKNGTGALILTGSNNFSGVTTLSSGTLQYVATVGNTVSGTSAVMSPNSQLSANGGTLALRADGDTTFTTTKLGPSGGSTGTYDVGAVSTGLNNTLTLNSTQAFLVGGGPGATMTFNVTGSNGDRLKLAGGAFSFADNNNTFVLNPTTANLTVTNSVANSLSKTGSILTLGGTSSDNLFSGSIPSTVAVSVLKSNSSTWTLSGSNSYTGATTVNGGKLLITGTLSGSATTVNSGGTLGGTGLVQGITLNAGGLIEAGLISDDLAATSLTWNGETSGAFAQMKFELGTTADLGAAAASDKLTLSGAFTKGSGTSFLFDFGGTGAMGNTYTLATFASTSFTAADFGYTGLANGLTATFAIDGTGTSLQLMVVPEPATGVFLLGGVASLAAFRRRRQS